MHPKDVPFHFTDRGISRKIVIVESTLFLTSNLARAHLKISDTKNITQLPTTFIRLSYNAF